MATLTDRQRRFVEEYLVDCNAAAAAERAGYSARTARQAGAENLSKPVIQTAIREAMEARSARTGVTADRVVKELARIAFLDPRKVMTWGPEGVTLLSSEGLSEDVAACISEASQTVTESGGTTRVKLCSKLDALSLLGKHLGMFEQKKPLQVDVTSGGKPLDRDSLTAADLAAAASLLGVAGLRVQGDGRSQPVDSRRTAPETASTPPPG